MGNGYAGKCAEQNCSCVRFTAYESNLEGAGNGAVKMFGTSAIVSAVYIGGAAILTGGLAVPAIAAGCAIGTGVNTTYGAVKGGVAAENRLCRCLHGKERHYGK